MFNHPLFFLHLFVWFVCHNYAGIIEGGKFHYLTDVATEHKKMLLQCPLVMNDDSFKWASIIHADIQVLITR